MNSALRALLLTVRHQLLVLQRQLGGHRVALHTGDRLLCLWLSLLWIDWRQSLVLVQPDEANPTWGAPRIHGELLKLGFALSQSTVSKYLPRHRKPPSQGWRTFLRNHLRETIAIDFAMTPTVTFGLLYVFVVLSLERRKLLHVNVTAHPTAEWTAQQMVEALPWETTARYVIRDRDRIYGVAFRRRVAGLGLQEVHRIEGYSTGRPAATPRARGPENWTSLQASR